MKIILATSNAHKVEELSALFTTAGLNVNLVPMTDVLGGLEIEETGKTFEENAYIKAMTVHNKTGLPVLADDSGLIVDALAGAPGVRSARYAGPTATDADNRAALQSALSGTGVNESTARFTCVLCYVDGLRTLFGSGSIEGTIQMVEKGANGFGYDSLFIPSGSDLTFAEHSQVEKAEISHRGRAVADLSRQFRRLTSESSESAHSNMLDPTDALMMASVFAVTNNASELRATIRRFVRSTNDALMLHEALLQLYLFAGFPAALDSLSIADEECKGILGDFSWSPAEPYNQELFQRRGLELCSQIYGSVFNNLIERLGKVSPELTSWMIVEGYGKTLSRDNLNIVARELCNVCVLAVLDRQTQLRSHVRGALLVGATIEQLYRCADIVSECSSSKHGDSILGFILLQENPSLNE